MQGPPGRDFSRQGGPSSCRRPAGYCTRTGTVAEPPPADCTVTVGGGTGTFRSVNSPLRSVIGPRPTTVRAGLVRASLETAWTWSVRVRRLYLASRTVTTSTGRASAVAAGEPAAVAVTVTVGGIAARRVR